jgi:hypothetical protein
VGKIDKLLAMAEISLGVGVPLEVGLNLDSELISRSQVDKVPK